MNEKYYIVFYPRLTLLNAYSDNYKVGKKTFKNWKKAVNFKKKTEFYFGLECSLVAIHCTEDGIFRTIQKTDL